MDKSQLVQSIRQLVAELGRTPTRSEFEHTFRGANYALKKHFTNNFGDLLAAAGFQSHLERRLEPGKEENLLRQYRKLCSKKEQIQGFFRHTIDLEELFRRAGNPPSLKISAQPDTHVKFRDQPAINCYLKFIKWYQPHVHLIMGDFLDCEGLSHWPDSSLAPRRIVPEAKEGRELLKLIIEATPEASTRIFLTGNHEDWLNQALSKMPELFEGLEELGIEISINKLLGLENFGYEIFPLNHLVQIGKAHFTHGIYTGTHHAKKHLDVFKTSVYYGHLHDKQSHGQTSIDGEMEAASLGCLCRKDAKFLKGKPNNWAHGSGAFEFFPDGSYIRYQVDIINGRSSMCGIIFDGNV